MGGRLLSPVALDVLFLDNTGLRRSTTKRKFHTFLNLYTHIHTSSLQKLYLAQAHVDAPALANPSAHLYISSTFQPLQPLHDTVIAGYLRHAHEQNLISTIEERC